jgi:hypothetical protein
VLTASAIAFVLYVVLVGVYARFVFRRARFSVDPMVELWSPASEAAPLETRAAFAEYEPQLAALGFNPVSGITFRHTTMELTGHLVCFRGPDAVAELAFNPGVPPKLSFWNPLDDERCLATTTMSPGAMHFVFPNPERTNVLPPTSPTRLLALHRRACVGRHVGAPPEELTESTLARARAQLRFLVASGFLAGREHSLGYSARAAVTIAFCWLPPIRWVLGFVGLCMARQLERRLA